MKNYISNLRNIATFAVIVLHVTAPFVLQFNKISFSSWQLSNFIDASLRFGVPIFVMISGAVLLDRNEPLKLFLTKRLKRVVLPFLFWSIVYFLFVHTNNFQKFALSSFSLEIFFDKLLKGTYYHLWYVYMILGIYLLIPFIRKWVQNSSKQELQYFLLLWAVTLFINTGAAKYLPNVEMLYFSRYIGYLVLGYYLDKHIETTPAKRMLYFIFFVLGLCLTFLSTSYLSISQNKLDITYYNYLSPNVCLMSIGVFLLGKSLLQQSNSLSASLDKHSYGIYLVHILVLHYVDRLPHHIYSVISTLSLLIYILAIAIISYTISYIIIKLLASIKKLQPIIT